MKYHEAKALERRTALAALLEQCSIPEGQDTARARYLRKYHGNDPAVAGRSMDAIRRDVQRLRGAS